MSRFFISQPDTSIHLSAYLRKLIRKNLYRLGMFPVRSPLLGKSHMLSFPLGTKMFQFPRFPRTILYIQIAVIPYNRNRVSPFGHPRIKARLAASRGLSQPTTSFFGVCASRHPLCALSRLLHYQELVEKFLDFTPT